MKKIVLLVATVLMASGAYASGESEQSALSFQHLGFNSQSEMDQYFSVVDVRLAEVITTPSSVPAPNTTSVSPTPSTDVGGLGGAIISVITDPTSMQSWVVLGQKIWDVIVANKPVANVATKRISILPLAEADWARMSNWQNPTMKTYQIAARNGFGMEVMRVDYTVAFNYGGKLDGHGQYLANATVIPSYVSVSWGFQVNAAVEMGTVLNNGSSLDPVPGVDMQMKWKMDSLLRHMEGVDSFYVRGDGSSARISSSM